MQSVSEALTAPIKLLALVPDMAFHAAALSSLPLLMSLLMLIEGYVLCHFVLRA